MPTQSPIDIKPGDCLNPLDVRSKGLLPIAILGSESLDVNHVDPASILLEGVAPEYNNVKDVANTDTCTKGPDGNLDMTLKFRTQKILSALQMQGINFKAGQKVSLALTGKLKTEFGAKQIKGSQTVTLKSIKAAKLKVAIPYKNGAIGTVTSGDTFINCPGDCEEFYAPNTLVTLTATTGNGSTFVKWTGKPCKDEPTNVCTFTMDKNATVKAVFDRGCAGTKEGLKATYSNRKQALEGPINHGWGTGCSADPPYEHNLYQNVCTPLSESPVDWAKGGWDGSSDQTGFSAAWSGYLLVPLDGSYSFSGWVDGIVHIEINGEVVADLNTIGSSYRRTVALQGGECVPVTMSFATNGGSNNMVLNWLPPGAKASEPVPRMYLRH